MRHLSTLWILAFAVTSACSLTRANADESLDAQSAWSRLGFAGQAVTPDPEVQVSDYLQYDRQQCGRYVDHIVKLTERYREHATASAKGAAKNDVKNIHHFLFAETGEKNPCFQSVAKAYSLASLKVLHPQYLMSKKRQELFMPGSPATFILAAALMNKGLIQFLTPTQRVMLGTAWQEKSSVQEAFTTPYRLRGAYACTNARIFLDPEMPPINLAANFEHELDHLLRDRLSPAPEAGSNWKEILLEDEVLALSTSIYSELILTSQPYPHLDVLQSLLAGRKVKDGIQYGFQIKDDENLFSLTGPFSKIFKGVPEDGFERNFLLRTFLFTDVEKNLFLPELGQIYNAVNTVYFPNTSFDGDSLIKILKSYASKGQVPFGLAHWLYQEAGWYYTPIAKSDLGRPWRMQLGNTGTFVVQLSMTPILKVTADLVEGLDHPSAACESLIAHCFDPDVEAYIGSKMQAGLNAGEGGVKGGEGGVKGGEAGVKGTEPVRACYLLEENQ